MNNASPEWVPLVTADAIPADILYVAIYLQKHYASRNDGPVCKDLERSCIWFTLVNDFGKDEVQCEGKTSENKEDHAFHWIVLFLFLFFLIRVADKYFLLV